MPEWQPARRGDGRRAARGQARLAIIGIAAVLATVTLVAVGYDVRDRPTPPDEPRSPSGSAAAPRPPEPSPQPVSDLPEAMSISAAAVEATSLSAYELWDAARSDNAAGAYGGAVVQTACYAMEGARWWMTVADSESCWSNHQLAWTRDGDVVTAFGAGPVGATIDVRPIEFEASDPSTVPDLDAVARAVADDAIAVGVSVELTSSLVIAGDDARRIDCAAPGYAHCAYYVVRAPADPGEAGRPQFFAVRLLGGDDWILEWSDITSRFTDTFEWLPAP